MCMSILPVGMSVYQVHSKCIEMSGEGIGVTDTSELWCGL